MRFAVEKCSSVLRENYFALEKITGIPLLMVSQFQKCKFKGFGLVTRYLLLLFLHSSMLIDTLLDKGEIKADEIWKIYKSSPRVPQVVCGIRYIRSSVHVLACSHNLAMILLGFSS